MVNYLLAHRFASSGFTVKILEGNLSELPKPLRRDSSAVSITLKLEIYQQRAHVCSVPYS